MPRLITFPFVPSLPLKSIFLSNWFQISFHCVSYDSTLLNLCGCFNRAEIGIISLAPCHGTQMFCNLKRRGRFFKVRAIQKGSPYKILGVSSNATVADIKRAYRKLALKYHPDVNKEENAEQKFMRIKHAYIVLSNAESRRKYDSGNTSSFSNTGTKRNDQNRSNEEESFYGFGDFFRDLQEDWSKELSNEEGKPKSLWEELSEIGEEFVEFLEQELGISDSETGQDDTPKDEPYSTFTGKRRGSADGLNDYNNLEENINEIEATLARLKKELGL